MKKFVKLLIEIFLEVVQAVYYFIRDNLRNFALILNVLLPFVMYLLGQYLAIERGQAQGQIVVGGEIFVPIVVYVIIYVLRSISNKIGKGYTIPVPKKRFTEVDSDGEVSVHTSRVQELLLYLADLEDWLERKGLL